MNLSWLAIVGTIYAILLIAATWYARRHTHSAEDYMLGGARVGLVVGALTYGATLFSTFTLMGMPDFFRSHGVGAWLFLGVADAAVAFVVLWYAVHIRRAAARHGFNGVAGLVAAACNSRAAGYLCFGGVFVFLIPYVAVQIRGISIFLDAVYPGVMPVWAWAVSLVVALLAYSEVGGLKAIIYSDALQGLLLLVVTWLVAMACVGTHGSFTGLVDAVRQTHEALLSTPGPNGLFGFQFMLASLLALLVLPVTQPQLAARLVILRDLATCRYMAITLGLFAMLVILPTLAIGLHGAVAYADLGTAEFLATVLVYEQSPLVGATVSIGLIAAAMSTADSQLFALGGELRSLLRGRPRNVMLATRVSIALFAGAALGFAVVSSDQLVLLARVSFAGTALLAPLILVAVLRPGPGARWLVVPTLLGLILFLGSVSGIVPATLVGVRLDLLLFAILGASACIAAARGSA